MQLGTRRACRFEVVGSYGNTPGSVKHVALLAQPTALRSGMTADVFDMGPPLRLAPPNPAAVHVLGWLPLTLAEEDQLDVWLSDMLTRAAECTYIAYPAEEVIRDPYSDAPTAAWRFSCAGFVHRAYLEGAGVGLVVPEAKLPALSFATIRALWVPASWSDEVARRKLSSCLRGEGPWPVLVPGYLLHALKGSKITLPHQPDARHLSFP